MSRRFQVRFEPSGVVVAAHPGVTVFRLARDAGLPMAGACDGEGICGACAVRVCGGLAPSEGALEADVKRANGVDPGLRLACRIGVCGDLVVTATYW